MSKAAKGTKRTKIVATIGPASQSPEVLKGLYEAGVNVFRLNFSHGTHESHGKVIDTIRSLNLPNASIMLDTKGPEIRTGEVRGSLHLKTGDKFTMTIKPGVYEDTGKVSVNYTEFIHDVHIGDTIIIDSGVAEAKALKKTDEDIEFEIAEGQVDITTKRHINLMGRPVSLPTVTESDWKDIDFGIEKKVDFIALSFVRTGKDVAKVKEYCRSKGVKISIISKIENFESTQNIEDIVKQSDGIMVARGDLACEISFAKVPALQKKIVGLCSYYKKPVIIATQMLLSMVTNDQPTRAEISDVGNAIFEGVDCVMTSDETTKSANPVHVIQTMAKICKETEKNMYSVCNCENEVVTASLTSPRKRFAESKDSDSCPHCKQENIISILPFITRNIDCIVAVCIDDDKYAKSISTTRLSVPTYGFTPDQMLGNQMQLIWNVYPVYEPKITRDYHANVKIVDEFLKAKGVKKYVLVADIEDNGKKNIDLQVRNL